MNAIESYEQAIEYLFSRINYERFGGADYAVSDFKLDRMRLFLDRLGNPQNHIPAVHIAGTKGKGSTAAMLAAILHAAGYTTGLFTSPHISVFEERIAINGTRITAQQLVDYVNRLVPIIAELDKLPGDMSPTYFEIATALGWVAFAEAGVQLAVLEVGLGGRLDATNVCVPAVTIITTISRDHTRQLGFRLAQIAREKGGIIKPGVPLVSGVIQDEPQAALHEIARELAAPLYELGNAITYTSSAPARPDAPRAITVRVADETWSGLPLPLPGDHQAQNLALAIGAASLLRRAGWNITIDATREGLLRLQWPGRIEIVGRHPLVIIDTAHNWASVDALVRTLRTYPARQRTLVFAATRDKDLAGMLRLLLPYFDRVILTRYLNNPRAVPTEELTRLAHSISDRPVHSTPDPATAWHIARRLSNPDDLICVTGSFFIAAELRDLVLEDVADRRLQASNPQPEAPQTVSESTVDRPSGTC